MAGNTKDIKRRIQSIGSIMQITNAMELVSSAKLRKARVRLEGTKPYFDTVYNNITEILSSTTEKSKLMEKREVKNRAILIMSSEKGLAGGYNINVVNEALKFFENKDIINHVFTTGNKSVDLMKRRGYEVNNDFTSIHEDPVIEDAAAIGSYFANKFEQKVFDEVVVVYTKFNSIISLEPAVKTILPAGFVRRDNSQINEDVSYQNNTEKKLAYDFEPSVSAVLSQMIKQFINVTIYGCLLESSVAEQASRRTAMENATSNGEEILEELHLDYNRARQSTITQEITEIVGGAEALK